MSWVMRQRERYADPDPWYKYADYNMILCTQYRREFDEKLKSWRGRPLHDWTSHGADSFRYLSVGYKPTTDWGEPIKRNLKGIA